MNLDNLNLLLPQQRTPPASYSWGKITDTNPARVTLDGETTPIYVTDTLAFPLTQGTRVYLQLRGSRAVILGTSPTSGTSVTLTQGVSAGSISVSRQGTHATITFKDVTLEKINTMIGRWAISWGSAPAGLKPAVPTSGFVSVTRDSMPEIYLCHLTPTGITIYGIASQRLEGVNGTIYYNTSI